ncbi:molecular chaperone GrpE [Christensenella minuta]|uniref:molecular chaperone GrpE n=1 Tax=Christensenella minuta TaxID=626937 RepID=UPI0021576061|nr:molecular chaperone GrpE [Christensenella minuta]
MWIFIGIGAFVIVVSIIFRVVAAFRLTIPLLYGLLAPTLFSKWFYANYELANFIGYALLALIGLSWVISLIRKIREFTANRREERFSEEILRRRIRESADVDENGYRVVNTDDLYR